MGVSSEFDVALIRQLQRQNETLRKENEDLQSIIRSQAANKTRVADFVSYEKYQQLEDICSDLSERVQRLERESAELNRFVE